MDINIFRQLADTLLSGRYSLLVGAGASLDSKNGRGDPLPSGGAYLKFLSDKKSFRQSMLCKMFTAWSPMPSGMPLSLVFFNIVFQAPP